MLKSVNRSYQIKGSAEFQAADGNALFNVTIPDLSKIILLRAQLHLQNYTHLSVKN